MHSLLLTFHGCHKRKQIIFVVDLVYSDVAEALLSDNQHNRVTLRTDYWAIAIVKYGG